MYVCMYVCMCVCLYTFQDIFLTNGASTGIQYILTSIIANPNVGVLIPIPQYPIYSALITLLDGKQLGRFSIQFLYEARLNGIINPKALVIILRLKRDSTDIYIFIYLFICTYDYSRSYECRGYLYL